MEFVCYCRGSYKSDLPVSPPAGGLRRRVEDRVRTLARPVEGGIAETFAEGAAKRVVERVAEGEDRGRQSSEALFAGLLPNARPGQPGQSSRFRVGFPS